MAEAPMQKEAAEEHAEGVARREQSMEEMEVAADGDADPPADASEILQTRSYNDGQDLTCVTSQFGMGVGGDDGMSMDASEWAGNVGTDVSSRVGGGEGARRAGKQRGKRKGTGDRQRAAAKRRRDDDGGGAE